MITTREISDNKSSISSTRWAFASVIKFDIIVIAITVIAYIVSCFIGKPFDGNFFGGIATLLGILTGLVTTSKALQGFEPHKEAQEETEEIIVEEK